MAKTLEQIKADRLRFLNRIYELSGGDEYIFVNMYELGKELNLERDEVMRIYQYLKGEMLIEARGMGGAIGITHLGVMNVEEALANPNEPTQYFPPANIILISGNVTNSQIQQGAMESTQSVCFNEQNRKELIELIKEIREEIKKGGILEKEKTDVMAEIETLESQLKKEKPNSTILKQSLDFIKRVITKTASGVLVEKITSLISTLH